MQKFHVSSKVLKPEIRGTPTRWWKESIAHQHLAICTGWHCFMSLILIIFWAGKEQDNVEQRSKQTACVSLNFPRSSYANRSPEQVCHAFCWRAKHQKLLQSVRKCCQFVKLPAWRKCGVLFPSDEKAQAIEHNTRGCNTALVQNVRMHLVPVWSEGLTDTWLDLWWPDLAYTPFKMAADFRLIFPFIQGRNFTFPWPRQLWRFLLLLGLVGIIERNCKHPRKVWAALATRNGMETIIATSWAFMQFHEQSLTVTCH